MVDFYIMLINDGEWRLENVPPAWYKQVAEKLRLQDEGKEKIR